MTSYLNLPNDLLASIVTDWLSWKSVGQLDSAVCSKDHRNRWLDLLRTDCIFSCVHVDHHRDFYRSIDYRWCLSRQIRTHSFSFAVECLINYDQEAVVNWLRNTAPLINTMYVYSSNGRAVSDTIQVCRHLRILSVNYCNHMIDNLFWELLRNNPNLEELYILGEYNESNFVNTVPIDLSLFKLKKLKFGLRLTPPSEMIVLFQQLPALERLKLMDGGDIGLDIYDCLPDSCPKLAHLDLGCVYHCADDNDRFYHLMSSLKSGLRCLVLPAIQRFTIRELQSIAHYHSHSLRCLSIPDEFYTNEKPDAYCIANLINSLPHLHTLYICLRNFASLAHKKITNPTITHLMINYYSGDRDLSILTDHCPAATTLSISNFNRNSLVRDITELLKFRPLIHTICMYDDKVITQLREALPTILVRKSTCIDIFKQEY